MTDNLQRRRSHRRQSLFMRFLRTYWFEIVWVAAIALGLFLIFERGGGHGVMGWFQQAVQRFLERAGRLDDLFIEWLLQTTVSDAIGFVLIIGAIAASVLRLRWRLLTMPSLSTQVCPKCKGAIHRVHRRWFDHIINWFVPVRRFRCANRECRWHGLRVRSTRAGSAAPPAPADTKVS